MKLEFFWQISETYTNIKFHKNPSSGSRVVPCGRTDRQTTKLIVAFRNFVNAPKNDKANESFGSSDISTTKLRYKIP
jgi:hypothetical protein